MISNEKIGFDRLLEEIRPIKIEKSGYLLGKSSDMIQSAKDNHQKIRLNLVNKIEKLGILSDILQNMQDDQTSSSRKCQTLQTVLDKSVTEISDFMLHEMPTRFADINLMFADYYFRRNETLKSLNCFKEVLKIKPDHLKVHTIVSQYANSSVYNDLKQAAAKIGKNYKLDYIDSFGETLFKQPTFLVFSKIHQVLLVSDSLANKIYKFNPEGKFQGSIELNLKQPYGIFEDKDANFWICDFGNSKLKKFDIAGTLLNEINLQALIEDKTCPHHPLKGTIVEGRLIILLTDSQFNNRKLIIKKMINNKNSIQSLPLSPSVMINDMETVDNRLYLGCIFPGRIYQYDLNTFRLIPIPMFPVNRLYCFTAHKDCFFIIFNDGKSLHKVLNNGNPVFSKVNLDEIVKKNLRIIAVKAGEIMDSGYLFVSDLNRKCIHKLLISTQSIKAFIK